MKSEMTLDEETVRKPLDVEEGRQSLPPVEETLDGFDRALFGAARAYVDKEKSDKTKPADDTISIPSLDGSPEIGITFPDGNLGEVKYEQSGRRHKLLVKGKAEVTLWAVTSLKPYGKQHDHRVVIEGEDITQVWKYGPVAVDVTGTQLTARNELTRNVPGAQNKIVVYQRGKQAA